MEGKRFTRQVQSIYNTYNHPSQFYSAFEQVIKSECRRNAIAFSELLDQLNNYPITIINLFCFKKLMRILKKYLLPLKDPKCQSAFTTYLIKAATVFCPYYLTAAHTAHFQPFISLFSNLHYPPPTILTNQKEIALYLHLPNADEQLLRSLIQVINDQIFVDKKSQQFHSFKLSPFFGPFVAKHLQAFLPSLQRLLIRSESNLEVWDEFFTAVNPLPHIDSLLLNTIDRLKNYIPNHPQICTKLITTLSSNLTQETQLNLFIELIGSRAAQEHHSKKKMIYLRMFQGIFKQLPLKSLLPQKILIILINSWVRLTQQEQYILTTALLNKLFPLIQHPTEHISLALKPLLKSTNKYTILLTTLTLASVYQQRHYKQFGSLNEACIHYKKELMTMLKKADVNWQLLLPVIALLSTDDPSAIEFLYQQSPLFKKSCLGLVPIQQKNGLVLINRYIASMEEQEESIPDFIYVAAVALLAQIKEQTTWSNFITALNERHREMLLEKGMFPLVIYSKKSYQSLAAYILRQMPVVRHWKTVVVADVNHINVDDKYEGECGEELVRFCLSNFAVKDCFEACEKVFIRRAICTLVRLCRGRPLLPLFKQFLIAQNYNANFKALVEFEAAVESNKLAQFEDFNELRGMLQERDFISKEGAPQKKIYGEERHDVRMKSEQEVKEEKLKKHYGRMLQIYQQFVKVFLANIRSSEVAEELWSNLFTHIVSISKFSSHRIGIALLVKKTFQSASWKTQKSITLRNVKNNTKQFVHKEIRNLPISQQGRIFFKYSTFFGDFYSARQCTPPVSLMGRCHKFLQQFCQLPLQNSAVIFKLIGQSSKHFLSVFLNDACQHILQHMQFDINLKRLSMKLYRKFIQRDISFGNSEILFTLSVKNVNILSASEDFKHVVSTLLQRVSVSRCEQFFDSILSYVQQTKKFILEVVSETKFVPKFDQYIKLRILAIQEHQSIRVLALKLLEQETQLSQSILTFNMKHFIQCNSKEIIERFCQLIKQCITPQTQQAIYSMVMETAQKLFDQNFDQQGLQVLPYFLSLNIDSIKQCQFKPIFSILINKFTAKPQFATLSRLSLSVGIQIIKRHAPQHATQLLTVLESFISKDARVSNIVFLGVLAPYLQGERNFQDIAGRITQLFRSGNESDQQSISKCLPDLMSFFKNAKEQIQQIEANIATDGHPAGQSYLYAGLLKGMGYQHVIAHFDLLVADSYLGKTKEDKVAKLHLFSALIHNFGRFIQIRAVKVIRFLIQYMSDAVEEIRSLAKKAAQAIIVKMSSYAVKKMLPQLLTGLQHQQQWRIKISYIWILGIMANCSARQLQTSLPTIVPTLSMCLSNAHPTIRDKASQALNLIGETIKNPQISQCVDVLIEALQNPFQKSDKAINLIKLTRFSHYIDPPSLSLIIPILDYCLRGRSSQLKTGSCQVIGSIIDLVANATDLLPYIKIITVGLKVTLCDPIAEIRSIASMAIGRIAAKIGIEESERHFKFVLDIIESVQSNTTEKQGAAQSYAQVICSQTQQYFQDSLNRIFQKLSSAGLKEKQGYILVFLYVPAIRKAQFQTFIKEVNENMYSFVSDEDENIRNSAMQVQKVLINNYSISHTQLLLQPLCEGIFESNWRKRNGALILIGQLLLMLKGHMFATRSTDKNGAYHRALMAVYVCRDDELQMPRQTANLVWNNCIENSPKTIRTGLPQLVLMWSKWTHSANGLVLRSIISFSTKYGENHFHDVLLQLQSQLSTPNVYTGVFDVLSQFIKRLAQIFLSKKVYRNALREMFAKSIFTVPEHMRQSMAKCLAIYVEKMHEETFFTDIIFEEIDRMAGVKEEEQCYSNNLHLLRNFLHTSSVRVADAITTKIVQPPLSAFKIEVITNNADKLANQLYTHFKPPATQVLLQEVQQLVTQPQCKDRLSLIVYCLNQVSQKLNTKNRTEYIHTLSCYIEKFKGNSLILETFLTMLVAFLNAIAIEQIDNLQQLMGLLAPLVSFKPTAYLVHKVFLIIVSDIRNSRTALYLKQLLVSFQNNTAQKELIWSEHALLKDYVVAMAKNMAYGVTDIKENALEMVQFVLLHTERSVMEREVLRLVGPMIRVLNYPLPAKIKNKLLSTLSGVYQQRYNLEIYTGQILSVTSRLLQQFASNSDMLESISILHCDLIVSAVRKDSLLIQILNRCKVVGGSAFECFYSLVCKVLSFNIPIWERIFDELNHVLYERKVAVAAVYYVSKTCARIGVYLKKGLPIDNLNKLGAGYEEVLNYLHFAVEMKEGIAKAPRIELLLKESTREKTFYLLKTIEACRKYSESTYKLYTLEYIKKHVPEGLTGFDQIADILQDYEEEDKEEQII